jgi:hypothetical protein
MYYVSTKSIVRIFREFPFNTLLLIHLAIPELNPEREIPAGNQPIIPDGKHTLGNRFGNC